MSWRPALTDAQVRAAFWLSYGLGGTLGAMAMVVWRMVA